MPALHELPSALSVVTTYRQWTTVRPSPPSYSSCHLSTCRISLRKERLDMGVSRYMGQPRNWNCCTMRYPSCGWETQGGQGGQNKSTLTSPQVTPPPPCREGGTAERRFKSNTNPKSKSWKEGRRTERRKVGKKEVQSGKKEKRKKKERKKIERMKGGGTER